MAAEMIGKDLPLDAIYRGTRGTSSGNSTPAQIMAALEREQQYSLKADSMRAALVGAMTSMFGVDHQKPRAKSRASLWRGGRLSSVKPARSERRGLKAFLQVRLVENVGRPRHDKLTTSPKKVRRLLRNVDRALQRGDDISELDCLTEKERALFAK